VLDQFTFVGLFLIVALIFGIVPPVLARFFRPKKADSGKPETDDNDVQTEGEIGMPFQAQYYILALVFVSFNVAATFLLLWALVYQNLALYAVIEAIIFILILFGALIYIWRKGALQWM
jgi:NADH-quinone oxidoreductase subunit A